MSNNDNDKPGPGGEAGPATMLGEGITYLPTEILPLTPFERVVDSVPDAQLGLRHDADPPPIPLEPPATMKVITDRQ